MLLLRKTIIIILSVVGGLFLLATVLSAVIGPRIKGIVVEQINKKLSVPVRVDNVQFSLIKKFPYASIEFTGISANGSDVSAIHEPLINAQHVYLLFNIFNVFGNNLKLKKIKIYNAELNCFIDENGNNNFDIFKNNSAKSPTFNLEVEEIELKNVNLIYRSKIAKREYRILAKELALKGSFSNRFFDLNADGGLFVEKFSLDNINYIKQKDVKVNVALHIDQEQKQYVINKAELQIAELKLDVNGDFKYKNPGTEINLNIKSPEAGLKEIFSLIPGTYSARLKDFRYDGNVSFNMRIKGLSDEKHSALITAGFGTSNSSLKPASSEYRLSNINFNGNYCSRISDLKPFSRLQLTKLDARLEGQPVHASIIIEDFSNPYIDLNVHSKINLEVLSRFYMPDTVESATGSVQIDAVIKGRSKDKGSWQSNGDLVTQNVDFRIKGKSIPFTNFNGKFILKGNQLVVNNFSGKAAASDFRIEGFFDNVLSYLLTKDEKIHGKASLTSANIDLNELLEDSKTSTVADTNYRLDFSNRLDINLSLNVASLSFRKFDAKQLKGTVILQNKVLSTQKLTLNTCEGSIALDGKIDASRNDSILIGCDASVNKININQLFYQLGNFGQNVIVDKNVEGKVTSTIQCASTWSKSLHCNPDRIYVKSNIMIEDGQLNNFEPMLSLSKYLKGADLKKITFSTLSNQIEIKNQIISFPAMHIQSSAMDLTASGNHSFENIVDYKLILMLSQILGEKVKEQNTEFGTVEDDGLGRMKLFISMKGPMSNPKISYDRKAVEQNISHQVKDEKQNLKGILKNEFGWFKQDSVKVTKTEVKPKKQELQLDTDD